MLRNGLFLDCLAPFDKSFQDVDRLHQGIHSTVGWNGHSRAYLLKQWDFLHHRVFHFFVTLELRGLFVHLDIACCIVLVINDSVVILSLNQLENSQ